MQKIIWNFVGTDVTFQSTLPNFERDVNKMSVAVGVNPNHPINIQHDDRPTTTVSANSHGLTTCATVQALQVGATKIAPKQTTSKLRHLPGDVGGVDSLFDPVTTTALPGGDSIGGHSLLD